MMNERRILAFIASAFLFFQGMAQHPPSQGVLMNFSYMYPGAVAKWITDSLRCQARFVLNKTTMTACYNRQGHWLFTVSPLKTVELPAGLAVAVKDNWNMQVLSAEKGCTPYQSEVYRLVLKGELGETTGLFTKEGLKLE